MSEDAKKEIYGAIFEDMSDLALENEGSLPERQVLARTEETIQDFIRSGEVDPRTLTVVAAVAAIDVQNIVMGAADDIEKRGGFDE